ncbi:centrosomal protein of 128 kDa isoform X3 [Danio rerio]|uniref:Centrosomal protein of 128 kDa isoform X3 n=7 Tax=Danio rerio TaxID=7955 RepID=A0AC58I1P0_DANRE
MDSSSESGTYNRPRGHRWRARERSDSGFPRDTHVSDISVKIDTLANTLQDTSRNLNKVDRMLEQYKEHADDQVEAMATLRESLEESVQHLQGQRLRKSTSGWRTSNSILQTSDLEDGSATERWCSPPTSTLRNYGSAATGNRRRSGSVAVHFRDATQAEDEIHSLHQSLRDLRSDQLRLGDDIDREISKRNRTDIETKKILEDLAGHVRASKSEELVSLRVEKRLQEIEDEMHSREQVASERHHIEKPDGMSQLQKMDDMRSQLLRIEKDHVQLQREMSLLLSQQRSARRQQQGGVTGVDSELERGLYVSSEVEELKKSIEQREKEKAQLAFQVEVLSADLEQHQLQKLSQLKEVQSLVKNNSLECSHLKAQLIESETRREELRSKAQEAIRQWKTKCKKLGREVQELKNESRNGTDKNKWNQERAGILSQQTERTRRQLADALGSLAQREEDVHRCEVDLAEARSRLVTSELKLQEAQENMRRLEEETQKQISLQLHLREENIRLQERVDLLEQRREVDQRSMLDLQSLHKNLTAAKADLVTRLAEVESSKKDLEIQLAAAQEESSSFGRQLELERLVHQKELSHLQEGKAEQDRDVHNKLISYQREREELEALVKDLKSEALADGELRRTLQLKLDKMKTECDKLTEELSTREESLTQLLRKYHILRKELNVKVKLAKKEEERRHTAEHSMAELRERLASLQTEQESILHATGAQIDSACQFLSDAKLEAITLTPGLQKDSHRWLAEVKTKLQWLCEEVREREAREKRLRRILQHHKEQMKTLKESKDLELQRLLDQIAMQERLLNDIQSEKRGLLEKGRKKEDELRNLQDRIIDLETSTKLALDHLESVPEKLSLLENFKDLEESQRQREMVELRYARYTEIVGDLQRQLEESKRRIQEYRDEKLDATCRSLQLSGLTSSLLSQSNILTNSSLSFHTSQKPVANPDLEPSLTQEHFNGTTSEQTSM